MTLSYKIELSWGYDDDLPLGFISGTMNWQKKSETQVIQAPAQITIWMKM